MFVCCGLFSIYEFCSLSVAALRDISAEQLRSRIPKDDVANGSPLGAMQWVPFAALVPYHLLRCVASAGCFFMQSSLFLSHVFNKAC